MVATEDKDARLDKEDTAAIRGREASKVPGVAAMARGPSTGGGSMLARLARTAAARIHVSIAIYAADQAISQRIVLNRNLAKGSVGSPKPDPYPRKRLFTRFVTQRLWCLVMALPQAIALPFLTARV